MGWPGLVGFVIAVGGVAAGPHLGGGHLGRGVLRRWSSAIWSIGMVVVWRDAAGPARDRSARPLPWWIAAFVIGLAGLALKDQGLAHRLAGWCFALGFVAAGVVLAN